MSVELHLWTMPVRGRSPRPALEGILRPFLQEHPKISVRIWVVPWGTVWDRFMSALKGRHGAPAPDLLQIDNLWTGTLACLGLLKELTPHLWEVEREGFLPALWESCRLPPTRRLFAVPWTLDLRVPHARREALARADVSSSDMAAWQGLEKLLARAPRARGPRGPSAWDGESLLTALAPWVWSAGGNFFTSDGRQSAFLDPEALKAVAFYRALLADGPAAGVWPAPLGALRDPSISVFPPPRGAAGRFACLGGGALAMAAGTRHPEESWRLLRHLFSPEAQRAYAQAAGLLPPRLPEAEDLLDASGRAVLRESLSCARILPPAELLGSFERLLQRHLSDAARRSAPWEDWRAALGRADEEARSLLSFYESAAV